MPLEFVGMRSTDDWGTSVRPQSYRESILYLYPNGTAPLTALMSKLKKEKVNDPQFHWWTDLIGNVAGAITGVYNDAALSSAYTSGATAGQTKYVKMAVALANQIRPGHQVLLRDASDPTVDVNGKVTAVVRNGASSYVAVKLLEADNNSTAHDLSDADRILVIGNINPEGGEMPTAIARNPVKYTNYTQIFRTPLSITRTAKRTRLRTGDDYKKAKREALEMHSIEMEMNVLFGIPTENTGDNGKPERTSGGIFDFLRTNLATNILNYSTDVTYATDSWLTSGELWFENALELAFRYGGQNRLALCGSGALLGIQRLAKNGADINIQPGAAAYGIKIMEWMTPFGVLNMMTHPLLSYETSLRNTMVILSPENMNWRYIDDTTFYADDEQQNTGRGRIDGTDEEFLTEGGYEFHHPETFMVLEGVGVDSAYSTTTP